MKTKTKLALAAALLVGTTSFAAAQGYDPNLANRYPAMANPTASAPHASAHQNRTLRTAPVGLYQGRANRVAPAERYQSRDVALPSYQGGRNVDWFSVDTHDRASSPYAGGGF
jgi:hypothetical protein